MMNRRVVIEGRRPILTRAATLAAFMGLVFFLGAACNRQGPSALRLTSGSEPAAVANPPLNNPPPGTAAPGISYADVVSRVSPAVITIHSQMRARAPEQYPFLDDPMFRDFFGDRGRLPQQPPQRREGLGSGVIVSADGYILTNHHVVDGAEQIKVDMNDNRTLDARVVGVDPPSDLALLKVEASNLPVLTLGDSDRVRVGDVVLAIGNPLGIGQTVTMGIISAKGRQTGLSSGSFEDFLQTDAPINQGNSGGALVSTNSELVGINSQILSPSGGSIGIGFAIPSNMARTVMETLVRAGKVRRGQLGITVGKVTSDVVARLRLKDQRGLLVAQVQPGSGAARAGIRQGDIVTAFNGTEVNEPNVFRNLVAGTAPGTEVTLTIQRDGREQQVRATLGEFSPQVPPPQEQ
ncbi:MAG: Do family serine endopeptidase [Pyrinomonadaceae bacterium]|nr:Do family serine endopeptidase [Pyrinomonadaceae bacterium]